MTRIWKFAAICGCFALPVSLSAQAVARADAVSVQDVTDEQWREDLHFMATELERRHADLYHSIGRAEFQAAVADLQKRIPELQRNQIIVGMMQIAALVGDGHTRIDPRKDTRFGFPSLPLKLYLFEDGLYVRAARPDHAALVGARIEAIGGVPVDEAIRRASDISARDNPIGPKLFVPLFLNMPDILHALGLSGDRGSATLRLSRDGRVWTESVAAGEVEPSWPPDTDISLTTPDGWVDAHRGLPPLWLQAPLDYHRIVALPERRALYVQLNMVTGIKGQSLDDFGRKIGARAAATNPAALILDLRLNQGGNGDLRNEFVRQLIKAEDEDTRLFILTARGTFSASQFILNDLDRLSHAIVIGEPASSRPSSFGDAYRTMLPNSGLSLRTSILYWQSDQNKDPWTWVDIAAPPTFADYAAGRDPALEAALTYVPTPSLSKRLLKAAQSGSEAAEILARFRADPKNRYADRQGEMMRGSQYLVQQGQVEAGLQVAEQVAVYYPDSGRAATLVALVAEMHGQPDKAQRSARRALEIDPNNRAMRSLLDRLEKLPS